MTTETPVPLEALVRHFADLRDGDHFGEVTRQARSPRFSAPWSYSTPPPGKYSTSSIPTSCSTQVRSTSPACTVTPAEG